MSTTTALSSSVPSRPSSGYERSEEEDPSSPVALIAGIPGSVVLLVIIVIVFLVYRRRYLKKRPRESTSSSKENSIQEAGSAIPQTNTAFQNDGANLYQNLNNKTRETDPYTTAYTVPQSPTTNQAPKSSHFYAPLNIPERKNIYESSNNQEVLYEVVESLESPESEAPLQSPGSSREEPLVLRSFKDRCYGESPKRPTSQSADEVQVSDCYGTNYSKGHPGGPVYSTLEDPYLDLISNCHSEFTYEPVYTTVKEDD